MKLRLRSYRDPLALLILAIVAAVVFRTNLTGQTTFPYDLVAGFQPPTAYIIENLKRGIWPAWVSRQSLGLPLYMMVQSDLWYPVTWLIAALNIEYGLWQANIVQVCHIVVGGFGAYKLSRAHGFPPHVSFLAGTAFLLTDGFFEQSQHVDYVRGFALTSWLFWALRLERRTIWPLRSVIALFVVCALIMLGAYPGQLIAFALIGPVYIAAQIWCGSLNWPNVRSAIILVGLSVLLAAAVAIPKYLPFFLDFEETLRADDAATLPRFASSPVAVFSTVFDVTTGIWPPKMGLRSFFVTGPIMFFVFACDRLALKKVAPLLFTCGVAALFCFDLPALTRASIFLLSRFPASDYRTIVMLGLILLGTASLSSLVTDRYHVAAKRTARGLILLTSFYVAGAFITSDLSVLSADALIALFAGLILSVFTAVTVLVWTLTRRNRASGSVGIAVLLLLTVADGARVHFHSPNWRADLGSFAGKYTLGYDIRFGVPRAAEIFSPHTFRPERIIVDHINDYSWRGFFSDVFVYRGYDLSRQLQRHTLVLGPKDFEIPPPRTTIQRFMAKASSGIVLNEGATDSEIMAALTAAANDDNAKPMLAAGVTITSFSDTALSYEIDLPEPKLFVENEIFWNGWSAYLTGQASGQAMLSPSPVLSALRAWHLPAGHYSLQIEFRQPHLMTSFLVAGGVGTASLALLVLVIWNSSSPPYRRALEA